jgi:hypothetical protein
VGLRWFNVLGLVMLSLALVSHEVVDLSGWHESNFASIAIAILYMSTALWLSFLNG